MDKKSPSETLQMTAEEKQCVIDVFDALISMDLILKKERRKNEDKNLQSNPDFFQEKNQHASSDMAMGKTPKGETIAKKQPRRRKK